MTTITLLLFVINIQLVLLAILFYDKWNTNDSFKNESHVKNISHEEVAIIVNKSLMENFSTSVFCTGTTKLNRECRFQNLCFDPTANQYLFFHGKDTKVYGVHYDDSAKRILLDLSSVNNHNAKFFRYVDVLRQMYGNRNISYVTGSSILFHRFNPENLMHAMHDDLLPFFHTRRKYFPVDKRVNAIVLDGRDNGPYHYIYELFMESMILLQNISKLTCFQDVIVGVSKVTTWYQYGFHSPQGPINVNNYPKTELAYFVEEFKQRVKSSGELKTARTSSSEDCVVFISRQTTRRIVNEVELLLKLSSHLSLPVYTIDLQYDPLDEIIRLVSEARFLVSTHGAQLILSLFLPAHATVIELFPFGVPSHHYTPYKTLVMLMGMHYIAWENKFENNTYPHPDWPANIGGIMHLSKELQVNISDTKRVARHLCCHDPYWLYRIYQDTLVDTKDLLVHISSFYRTNEEQVVSNNNLFLYYPEQVTEVTCRSSANERLRVDWRIPWNVQNFLRNELKFEIVLKSEAKGAEPSVYFVDNEETFSLDGLQQSISYSVKIRCYFRERKGEFSNYIKCNNNFFTN